MKKFLAPCLMAIMLLGCGESGPQKALNNVAQALDAHNATAFLGQMDMDAYAQNYIKNLAGSDEALSSLNTLGQLLGLGNLDNLLGTIVDMKARFTEQFNRGVASGELMAQCRASTTADCPWVPKSLREAQVVELSANAAIAKITTPEKLVCWLVLRKIDKNWLIIGQAVMENTARNMALGNQQPQGQDARL